MPSTPGLPNCHNIATRRHIRNHSPFVASNCLAGKMAGPKMSRNHSNPPKRRSLGNRTMTTAREAAKYLLTLDNSGDGDLMTNLKLHKLLRSEERRVGKES